MLLAQYGRPEPSDVGIGLTLFGLALFLAIAGGLLGWAYLSDKSVPKPPFLDFAKRWARKRWGKLTIGLVLGFLFPVLVLLGPCTVIAALVGGVVWLAKSIAKWKRDKALAPFREPANAPLLAWGRTFEERDAEIRKFFEQAEGTVGHAVAYEFDDRGEQNQKGTSYCGFRIRRSIGNMEPKYREVLRGVELLNNAADGRLPDYRWMRFGLILGDGRPLIDDFVYHMWQTQERGVRDGPSMLAWYAGQAAAGPDESLHRLMHLLGDRPMNDRYAKVQAELQEIFGQEGASTIATGGSNAWLKSSEVDRTIFKVKRDAAGEPLPALMVGQFDDGEYLTFGGDESLFTIAPPGSGKTQCNVFPNLLTWPGAAVVLDVSGDIYEKTSKWRAENVGPVFKFSPLDPSGSHSYSPLSLVRGDPMYVWEDSRMLAELMIVPSKSSDPFWENEARNLVAAAIARVAYNNPPENRPMHAVIDVLYGGQAWNDLITDLSLAVDVRTMANTGTALASMNEKTADSVRQSARSSLTAWAGERIARVTAKSDWSPHDLRRADKPPTIYIVVRPNEVDSYLSLLRVFIGQHIRALTSEDVPPVDAPRILFMLDELPRLKHMPPVEEALNIGRKYKIQLWMFAQSFGQMKESYGDNAEGMVGNCGVRIYMNPSLADGTAEKLADQIGTRKGAMDGNRERVVEPHVLAGEAFKNLQVVFSHGAKPARVRKVFAYEVEALKVRMGSL